MRAVSGLRRAAYVPEDEREKRVIALASKLRSLPWRPRPIAALDRAAARDLLRELEAAPEHAEIFTRTAGWPYEDALNQLLSQGQFKGEAIGLLVELPHPTGVLTTVDIRFGPGDADLKPPPQHVDDAVVRQGEAVYRLARSQLSLPERCRGASWSISVDAADELEGSCLGLTLFAAIYAAAYGVTLPPDMAWTGSLQGHRVHAVEHLTAKIDAAAQAGVRKIVLATPTRDEVVHAKAQRVELIVVKDVHDVIAKLHELRAAPPPTDPTPAPIPPPAAPPGASFHRASRLALFAVALLDLRTAERWPAHATSPPRPQEPVIVALRELEPVPLEHGCVVDLRARGVSPDRAGWICVLRRAADEGARGVVLGLQLVDHGPRPWAAGADLGALSDAITALHAAQVPLYAVANADGGLLRRCPSAASCATALLEDDVLPARPVHVGEPCVTGTPTLAYGIAVLRAGAPDLVDVCYATPVSLPSLPADPEERPWITTTIGALLGDRAPRRDPLRPEDALSPPPARLTDRVLVIGAQVWPGHPHAFPVVAADGAPRSLAPAELHAWIGANLNPPARRGAP